MMRLFLKFPVILIISFLLFYFGALTHLVKAQSGSATLSFEKANATSKSISAYVVVDTQDSSIRAVTADFSYSPDILEFQEITINKKICKEVVKQDISSSGIVYLSCYIKDGYKGKGEIATVDFKIIQYENTKLLFSNNTVVIDAETHSDILSNAKPADITIPSSLSQLPQTGVEETEIFQGVLVLIIMLFILLLTIAGFSTWGGIYLSLGKWEVEGRIKIKSGKSNQSTKKAEKPRKNK